MVGLTLDLHVRLVCLVILIGLRLLLFICWPCVYPAERDYVYSVARTRVFACGQEGFSAFKVRAKKGKDYTP